MLWLGHGILTGRASIDPWELTACRKMAEAKGKETLSGEMSCFKTLFASSSPVRSGGLWKRWKAEERFPLSHNPDYGYGQEFVDVGHLRG